jgi:hypothetical protein
MKEIGHIVKKSVELDTTGRHCSTEVAFIVFLKGYKRPLNQTI